MSIAVTAVLDLGSFALDSSFVNLNKYLFHGEPRLEDVKQNPQLQDCWCLSSITSMLTSQGTASITRLFSPSEKPNHVNIRLGVNIYEVPLGKYRIHQATNMAVTVLIWVVALENAVTMHLAVHARADNNDPNLINKKEAQLALHSASNGIIALQGRAENGIAKELLTFDSAQFATAGDAINAIKKFLDDGKPVVRGHSSKSVALSDGIAPGMQLLSYMRKETNLLFLIHTVK